MALFHAGTTLVNTHGDPSPSAVPPLSPHSLRGASSRLSGEFGFDDDEGGDPYSSAGVQAFTQRFADPESWGRHRAM